MDEIEGVIGWILTMIGAGFAINAVDLWSRNRPPKDFDTKPFPYELQHLRRVGVTRPFQINVLLGLILLGTGGSLVLISGMLP